MTQNHPTPPPGGVRGILSGVGRLEAWLHAALVLLVAASAVRYVQGHGLDDNAPWVLLGAVALLLVYVAYPRSARARAGRLPAVWCLLVVSGWVVLVQLAPSFAWGAVPLSFVALRVLPFRAAGAVVAAMTLAVVVAWSRMLGFVDPTVVLGPVSIAGLAVLAYRTLEREATARQRLLDDLRAAQGDLVQVQREAGALGERARLSREIHDSVAQGLSSINLLLQAAEQDWEARPQAARRHVGQAALAARDALDEVRQVVRDLAPAPLAEGTGETSFADVLRRECLRACAQGGVDVTVRVHGTPVVLPPELATALLRTARGGVANVVEHARASSATVTLTYEHDCVALDVRDDGDGFDPAGVSSRGTRGHGLAGIRRRAEEHGGELVLESAPGEGTALAVRLPLPGDPA